MPSSLNLTALVFATSVALLAASSGIVLLYGRWYWSLLGNVEVGVRRRLILGIVFAFACTAAWQAYMLGGRIEDVWHVDLFFVPPYWRQINADWDVAINGILFRCGLMLAATMHLDAFFSMSGHRERTWWCAGLLALLVLGSYYVVAAKVANIG